MKRLKSLYLLAFALFLSSNSYSQEKALTSIQKNVNEAAHGLEQRLNFTLDTLTLKSDMEILRVTFLSHDEKDSNIIDVGASEIKIPLYHFKKGRYTIAVYREDKIIALGVNRLNNITAPKNAITDLEESILRSSLSEKEQLSRNIKPLKKTVEAPKNTRLASVKSKTKLTKKVKDKRVAAVKSKKISKSKRVKKKRIYSNKKSAFALAAEREAAAAKRKTTTKVANEKEAVLSIALNEKEEPQDGTLIAVTKVTYNLTQRNDKSVDMQSREEYRKSNLRPNGTPYND